MPKVKDEVTPTIGTISQQAVSSSGKKWKPSTLADLNLVYGWSGTKTFSGMIVEDYNTLMQGRNAMWVYEEMRRSDPTVKAALLICKLPILSAKWYVEPAKDKEWETDDEAWEVQTFVEKNLFERMGEGWNTFLNEALTMFAFGFSLFEKVYTYRDNQIILSKLAFRKQSSVERWETSDGEPWIRQQLYNAPTEWPNKDRTMVDIPASKLLRFTIDQEGENYEGISLLRPAYKPWYIKTNLEKFDAIRHEKQGVGVPIWWLPSGASASDKATMRTILNNFKTNEQAGITMPGKKEDWRNVEFLDLKAWDGTQILESIKYFDRQISKSVLAQFLELGATDSWSRAVSQDQSSMFLTAIESFAKIIQDTINKYLIPELVSLNYNVENMPKLQFKKIDRRSYSEYASTLQAFVTAGALNVEWDEDIEQDIRDKMELPPKAKDDGSMEDDAAIEDATMELEDMEDEDMTVWEDELAELESGIDELDGAESDEEVADAGEKVVKACENLSSMMFRWPLSEETKKKISEALKKWTSTDIKEKVGKISEKIAEVQDMITTTKETFDAKVEGVRSKIEDLRLQASSGAMKWKRKAELKQAVFELRKQVVEIRRQKREATKKIKQQIAALRAAKEMTKKAGAAKKTQEVEAAKAKREAERAANKQMREQEKIAKQQEKARKVKAHEHGDCGNCLHDEEFAELCEVFNNKAILQLSSTAKSDADRDALKKKGLRFNEFESSSFRPMTFAERKVDFLSIKKAMDKNESKLSAAAKKEFEKMRDDLLEQIEEAIVNNDIASLGVIRARTTWDVSKLITEVQKDMFEMWKKTASTEMWVVVPDTAAEVKGVIKLQADALTNKIEADMVNNAKLTATSIISRKAGDIVATGKWRVGEAVKQSLDAYITKTASSVWTLGVTMAINLGRATVFERYPEKVYAVQYSAIIDERTTDRCLSLDGRVVKKWSKAFYDYNPPQHRWCRSIRVEILVDEEFKPSITWIPDSIEPTLSLDNTPVMTKPVVYRWSPAIPTIRQEIRERKAKLEELLKTGQYANRQEAHTNRIKDLEKSLEGLFSEMAREIMKAEGVQFTR